MKCKYTATRLTNNLFAEEQHGCRAGHSCTQSISAMEAWTDTLQNGVPIDVVYLDFSKAFNSVPHQRLLVKLREYGIQGKLFDWDETFLNS